MHAKALSWLAAGIGFVLLGCSPMTPPPRLVPDDYPPNAAQLDSVQLPEAWAFMEAKWQTAQGPGGWPFVVVIDEGFRDPDDFGRRMDTGPAYGGAGTVVGTSAADTNALTPDCRGFHGTSVALVLGAISNNQRKPIPCVGCERWYNVAGAAGPWWTDPSDFSRSHLARGIEMLPVRIAGGAFGLGCGSVPAMTKALRYAAGETPEYHLQNTYSIRVVNISKQIVPGNDLTAPPDPDLQAAMLNLALKAVVVLASGDDRQVMSQKGWLAGVGSVVIVGALDRTGTTYWEATNGTNGTRRGAAVDIYAPGEAFTLGPETVAEHSADGASFAAPIVSGVLAMMWNANPCMTNEAHVQTLLDTADSIHPPQETPSAESTPSRRSSGPTRWEGRAGGFRAVAESGDAKM